MSSKLDSSTNLLGTYELLPPERSFPQAIEFAGKALQLDSTISEAYTVRASAESFYELDWAAAERGFQRAIALDPSSACAHHWYGEHFINVGNAERALSELKRARELDPPSLPINGVLGRVYSDAHHYDEAVQQCKKTLELDPNFSMGHWCLGQAYIRERQYLAAVPELERASALGATPLLICDLGCAYAGAGKNVEARAILKTLKQKAQLAYVSHYLIATIYSALGEKNEALKWLQSAFDRRDSHIVDMPLDPKIDPLRSTIPAFDAAIAFAGLEFARDQRQFAVQCFPGGRDCANRWPPYFSFRDPRPVTLGASSRECANKKERNAPLLPLGSGPAA